jgi:cobalamin 5'-phosphate synthase/cobalamin synthase
MTDAEDKRSDEAGREVTAEAVRSESPGSPPVQIKVVPAASVEEASASAGSPPQDSATGEAAGSAAHGSAGGPSAEGAAAGSTAQGANAGATAQGPAAGSPAPGRTGRRFTLAVTFLTGIPLKVEGEVSPSDLWGSMGWYPLVGLVMGLAAWLVYAGLISFLPGLVAAALVVILLELLTRGLHLDGLMDTADGILSGAPRERALEIMKDHNVGAMGVAAAVLLLILKVAALGALSRADAAAPLIAGLCAARALPALGVYHWPYARPAGTGEAFTRERTPGTLQLDGALLFAGIVVAGLVALIAGAAGSWFAGLVVAAVAMAASIAVQAYVARRLGGLSGDVYGMGIEIAEAAAFVMGCAIVGLAM